MSEFDYDTDFSKLKGRTIASITGGVGDDRVTFTMADGTEWQLYHDQDCCEHVELNDIAGDMSDLIGNELLMAEQLTNEPDPTLEHDYTPESETWTFYRLSTIKGTVTLRWHGQSNGYYSERVYFRQVA